MTAVELTGVKIWLHHLKALEMRIRKLVLDLSVAQMVPEKIDKIFLPKKLGFIDVLSTVSGNSVFTFIWHAGQLDWIVIDFLVFIFFFLIPNKIFFTLIFYLSIVILFIKFAVQFVIKVKPVKILGIDWSFYQNFFSKTRQKSGPSKGGLSIGSRPPQREPPQRGPPQSGPPQRGRPKRGPPPKEASP